MAIPVVAGVVRLPTAVMKTVKTPVEVAAAITAVAHAPPTPASHGKTQVTAATVQHSHVANADHRAHARQETTNRASRAMKCSARIHVARAWTWASSVMILTNASRPAMCQPAFHHQACPRVAQAVAEAVIAAVVGVAAASAEVAPAMAAVAEVIRVAGFGADWIAG